MINPSAICIPIIGPAPEQVLDQIQQATPAADLIELRLDRWSSFSIEQVASILRNASVPMIVTLLSNRQWMGAMRQLLELEPPFIDIQLDALSDLLPYRIGKTQVIGSYHAAPDESIDMQEIHRQLRAHSVDICKIARWASTPFELLDTLHWVKSHPIERRVGVCMGEYGPLSRIMAPLVGAEFTFASLSDELQSAPGQIPAAELIDRYRFREISPSTSLFALLGDPVSHSPGPRVNNELFRQLGLDALFVPIRLTGGECQRFLRDCTFLPFKGMAVTMPHKERMVSLVDRLTPEAAAAGAVNTLRRCGNEWVGSNTDGRGALDAIEEVQSVENCLVAVVGAGGTGRAVAYEAMQRGAEVVLLNRTERRAAEAARLIGCQYAPLEWLADLPYDVLVHCTPVGMGSGGGETAIPAEWLREGSLLLDVVITPRETQLMRLAQAAGCQTIGGIEMWRWQLYHQYCLWFDREIAAEMMDVYMSRLA
jgi:shikimate dehydrogenase/3-dehydroquinate dehydratase type I